MRELEIISDFEEMEFDLGSIGLVNFFLCIEQGLVYVYNTLSDFYYELSSIEIDTLIKTTANTYVINDEGDIVTFNKSQLDIIKNLLLENLCGKATIIV
jgi:hypothetical protein